MTDAYIAVDFGGGSGRVIAGYASEGRLELDTIYRFQNRQVRMGGHIYWDFLALFEDMKKGLRMAVDKGYRILSIGIDTWGVDFGLIDRNGNLLGNPVCYRDPRTEGMPEKVFSMIDRKDHYSVSGTQVMDINTLFQLYAMKMADSSMLSVADKLLFMPDLFSYYLTGVANNEYSIASTSELMDIKNRKWNYSLICELGLPKHIFCDIVMPGEDRGMLKPEIKEELGIDYDVKVVAVASHDTASAVYAVPQEKEDGVTAFLSSGTWSLLGVVTDNPILSEEARINGFTNEGGVDGKICFLQNITGLWILQKLMSEWADEGKCTQYDVLIPAAENTALSSVIDVDDARFVCPANMASAISDYCRETGQQIPESQEEFVKCVLMSLAERYRKGIEDINKLLPSPIKKIQIIGGGSQNKYLNKLTSIFTGLEVEAGPAEATAIGNIKVQMNTFK